MRPVVWMPDTLAGVLCDRLADACTDEDGWHGLVVGTAKEFIDATRDARTVSFVDESALKTIEAMQRVSMPGPVVAVCETSLQTAVGWLPVHPWLSHVMSAAMLGHPMATEHLRNVLAMLSADPNAKLADWLGTEASGRRVRLTHANRRIERLEKMSEFFQSKGAGTRTVQQLRDVAEELLTNAFYDAPVAAGVVKHAISRTQDVALPEDSACDLIYAWRDDLAIVRVRDPFGALTRSRLVDVLMRCARTDMKVQVDETMGGAGLGLWRVFAVASFVAVSVLQNRHTEIMVGIGKRTGGTTKPFAFHLFFKDSPRRARGWRLFDEDASEPSINRSVAIMPDELP